MVTIALCGLVILLVALIACRQQRDAEPETTEFAADFDALQHERERLDEIKRKSHAAERMIEAQRFRAMNGPAHDPVEL